MTHLRQFTAIIEREDDLYVALCPELDIASQGKSITEARDNLAEAIELFFEVASPAETEDRLSVHRKGGVLSANVQSKSSER